MRLNPGIADERLKILGFRTMSKLSHNLLAAAVGAALLAQTATLAAAAPLPRATAITPVADTGVEQIQYRRGWRGPGVGAGVAAGIIGGAIIGGAIARSYEPRPYYYYPRAYYAPPPPVYYAPAPSYAAPYDDEVAYCMRRFRSYDPRTGTYLGFDGYRHPCP